MSTLPSIRLWRRAFGFGLAFWLGAGCAHQEQGELPPGRNENGVNSSGAGGSGKAGSSSYGGSYSSAGNTSSSGGGGGTLPSAGASGSGGLAQAGSGGAAGGSGGSGGSGGTTGDPMYVELEGFHLEYQAINTTDSGPYISAELDIVNGGPLTVPIDELALRYYFTNENSPDVSVMMNWANANTTPYTELSGKVTSSVVAMAQAVTGADTYMEFTFSSGGAQLTPGTVLKLSFQLSYNGGAGTFVQSDDWSYNSAHTSLTEWDQIVLLRNGDFAWGSPPG